MQIKYEPKFFAKYGIASLVCDKSGAGLSETKKSWQQQTFNEKTAEYMQLIDWMSKQVNINPNQIGVHGMSEGGRLCIDMAIKHPDKIAFVNSVSGPFTTFKENQLYAIYHYLYNNNTDHITITKALYTWNEYFDDIAEGEISTETLELIKQLRAFAPNIG